MAGVIWKIIKTAATNVPWGRLVQNAPAVVDLAERVKERLVAGTHFDLHGELESLREENVKLAESLLQTSARVDQLGKVVEVMTARVKMLTTVAVVSLLLAVASLVACLVK